LERCEHLKRRKELYEAKYPQTRRPKGGRPPRNSEIISSFSADTADKARVTQRTVQQEVQIAERLVDDVRDVLRGTGVADSKTDLLRLAKMPAERQRAVTRCITSEEARGVKEAARQLDRHEQCEAVRNYTPPEGRFSVIVADPPWPYECRANDPTHRGASPYPSMPVEDICNLKLPADRDCVLWLWTTNAFMRQAFQVLDAWAFQDKTILTWVKDRMGVGNWLRGQTEHCILAVKGSPVVTLQGQSTVLRSPVREHSRKPDAFYSLVEAICPARTRLDLFAREQRSGWVCAGAEATKFNP
jgi:N6-adenosine-specific RNA methylase IME4